MTCFKISYRENTWYLNKGEYRIAIYYIPAIGYDYPIGFHIARQDKDGVWSEKPSWKGKVRKLNDKTDTPPDLSKYGPILETFLILSKN